MLAFEYSIKAFIIVSNLNGFSNCCKLHLLCKYKKRLNYNYNKKVMKIGNNIMYSNNM